MAHRDRHTSYATYSSYNGGDEPNQGISVAERFANPPPPSFPSPVAPSSAPSLRPSAPSAAPSSTPSAPPASGYDGPTRVRHVDCDTALRFLQDESRHYVRDASGKPIQPVRVFIKISTDWCGPCKKIAPFLHALSADKKYHDIVFLEVNGDELMQHNALSKALPVSAVPSFFGFVAGNKKGMMTGIKEQEIIDFCNKIQRS